MTSQEESQNIIQPEEGPRKAMQSHPTAYDTHLGASTYSFARVGGGVGGGGGGGEEGGWGDVDW